MAVALPPERAAQAVHAWKLRQPSSEQAEVPPSQQVCRGTMTGCSIKASHRGDLVSVGPIRPSSQPEVYNYPSIHTTPWLIASFLLGVSTICLFLRPPSPLQAAGGVNVVIKAGQSSVLLQDAFHVPLLEVSLGSGKAASTQGL